MSPNKPNKKISLDQLTKEAVTAKVPEKNWDKIEASLFDRIDSAEASKSEEPALAEVVAFPHPFPPGFRTARSRQVGMVVASMAVAASVAFFALKNPLSNAPERPVAVTHPLAGSLIRAALASNVLVNGRNAPVGQSIFAEDDIVIDERAEFERPGAVSWIVERDRGANSLGTSAPAAHVKVARADGSLVLALSEGAVEAEVVPVHAPESFAVEIAYEGHLSRVSVHGTHLRVVRRASRVIVDLTHGVVSIDVPELGPNGSGEHITAPSHIEYDARDPRGTTVITHPEAALQPAPHAAQAAAPASPVAAKAATPPSEVSAVGVPNLTAAPPAAPVPAETPVAPAAAPRSNVSPEQAISEAIQACSASVPGSAGQVKLTIASSLELHVAPNGTVSLAKFDPPLPPDVQTCAARAIYKTRFSKGGILKLPVEITR